MRVEGTTGPKRCCSWAAKGVSPPLYPLFQPPAAVPSVVGGREAILRTSTCPFLLIRYNCTFSLEANFCEDSFKHPQAEVPTLQRHSGASSPPASQQGRGAAPLLRPRSPPPVRGAPTSRPGRAPSPAQHLDLQIFPRSKIMARRWLRSPRIRNTFMVRPVRSQLLGNFSGGRGGCHVPSPGPGPGLWVLRPRAPRSRPGAAAPPARSWPGGDVAGPAAVPGSQEAPPPEIPPPGPAQRLGSRGGPSCGPGGFRPGLADCRPGPLCVHGVPATSHPADTPERGPGSPGPCLPCLEPRVTVGEPLGPSFCLGSLICTQSSEDPLWGEVEFHVPLLGMGLARWKPPETGDPLLWSSSAWGLNSFLPWGEELEPVSPSSHLFVSGATLS